MTDDDFSVDELDAALAESARLALTHRAHVQHLSERLTDCWASCVALTANDVAALLGHVDLARLALLKARHEHLKGHIDG